MRAALLREYGSVPQPADVEEPGEPGDGEELVEVVCAGLNPVDRSVASGTFYAGAPDLPYTPGREGIGRRAGGVLAYFDAAVPPSGSLAQRAMVRTDSLVDLPEGADPHTSIAFGVAGLAGWLALEWRAHLQPGETVLVLGASGTVGLIAVQAARILGAGRVVAAGRSEAGLERAARAGAHARVTLGGEDDAATLREAAGGDGFDVVVDPVWGAPAAAAVQAMAYRGRLVQLGQSAGAEAPMPSSAIRGRMLEILGHTNFMAPPEVRQAAFLRMVEHHMAGELMADIERVSLEDVADAWERQGTSPGAKLVVVP